MGWETIESRRLVTERGESRRLDYLPSRADIIRECEAIQATWSHAEREKRRVVKPLPILFEELSPSEAGLPLNGEWRM